MLDTFAADDARIVLALSLTAPTNQQDATLVFPGLIYAPIPLPAQGFAPGQQTAPSSIANAGVGLPTAAFVPLDTRARRDRRPRGRAHVRGLLSNGRSDRHAHVAERVAAAGRLHRRQRQPLARGGRRHGRVRPRRIRQQFRPRLRPADVHAHRRARQRVLVRKELRHARGRDPPARLLRDRGHRVQPAREPHETRRRSSSSSSRSSKTAAATRRASRASTSTVAASASHPATAPYATAAQRPPGVSELAFDATCGDPKRRDVLRLADAAIATASTSPTAISRARSCRGTSDRCCSPTPIPRSRRRP